MRLLSYLILKERLSSSGSYGNSDQPDRLVYAGIPSDGRYSGYFSEGILFAVIAVFGVGSEGVIIGFVMNTARERSCGSNTTVNVFA